MVLARRCPADGVLAAVETCFYFWTLGFAAKWKRLVRLVLDTNITSLEHTTTGLEVSASALPFKYIPLRLHIMYSLHSLPMLRATIAGPRLAL